MDKQVVLILSSMRAGSTLLKALLAEAPDVSHLPEVDFQRYCDPANWEGLAALSDRRILVLKKPAWLADAAYPGVTPFEGVKKVVLIRNPYDTVGSLRRMLQLNRPAEVGRYPFPVLVEDYWCRVYENIAANPCLAGDTTALVGYEDLVMDPVRVTRGLFRFIESQQQDGVRTYHKPELGMEVATGRRQPQDSDVGRASAPRGGTARRRIEPGSPGVGARSGPVPPVRDRADTWSGPGRAAA